MTIQELENLFQQHGGEFRQFNKVQNKLSKRRDLHAFLLVDKIMDNQGCEDNIAMHGRLNVTMIHLAERVTEEQVVELIRCGCFFDPVNKEIGIK